MARSRHSRWASRGFGIGVMATAAIGAGVAAQAGDCVTIAPAAGVLDCNGNGTPDAADIANGFSLDVNTNGVPDECDFRYCSTLWDGFSAYGPGDPVTALDINGDGIFWQNPLGSATIQNVGCEGGPIDFGVAVAGNSALADPTTGYVESEYLRTVNGALDCGSAIYTLTFKAKLDQAINSKVDFEYFLYDAKSGKRVVQLEFPATGSNKVPTAQRGKVLVKDPAGSTYFNTNVAIVLNTCMTFKIELNNVTNVVSVYVNDLVTPKVVTTRQDAAAYRADYFRVQAIKNLASSGPTTSRFCLDKVTACVSGPALMDWADCNGNCVDDLWDIANNVVSDCNTNGIPDTCDEVVACGCDVSSVVPCLPCNHQHTWQFEPAQGFLAGNIECQEGWRLGAATASDAGVVVVSGAPFAGKPGFTGQALKIKSKLVTDPVQGVRGPRTSDERPGKPGTADPGMEYWEFDALVDAADPDGAFAIVVWDECANSFQQLVGGVSNPEPACFSADPPTCLKLEEGELPPGATQRLNTYAYFNAGVRFRYQDGGIGRVLTILSNGAWVEDVNQINAQWFDSQAKHITIRIDNEMGSFTYWKGVHVPGQLDTGGITLTGGAHQNPNGNGDRQVLLLTNSTIQNAWVDNLKYTVDDDCDHDSQPDSVYLPGGVWYSATYDTNADGKLDWCQDCNKNCRLDSVDIAGGTSKDCNANGIPDECDINASYPSYLEPRSCSGQPWTQPTGSWSYYTRRGGGSYDANTNGTPDECEAALDCNANGMLDACELSCTPGSGCAHPPAGCGLGHDCNANGILDDCEGDCNGNRFKDTCDIASGTSHDYDMNGQPDECEIDCNGNGSPDTWEIALVPNRDCNHDGVLDVCQVMADCNTNAVADACDIASGTSQDCDGATWHANGIPDSCDIANCPASSGRCKDTNANGIPDGCEPTAAMLLSAAPATQMSLWRSATNTVRLTFNQDITAPTAGQIVIQKLLDGGLYGPDLSAGFTFEVAADPNQANQPRILKIRETGTSLTHRTWIGIRNTGGWSAATNFEVQYVVQVGDANGDGKVLNSDLSAIFPRIPTLNASDQERADVNGDGNVLNNDLSTVFPRIPSLAVPKPSGHQRALRDVADLHEIPTEVTTPPPSGL
jgi:hypothetical protein